MKRGEGCLLTLWFAASLLPVGLGLMFHLQGLDVIIGEVLVFLGIFCAGLFLILKDVME